MDSVLTLGLGAVFAWTILKFFQVKKTVSYYTLQPWPLEMDNSNLALIGVGLASPKPKPSVMDATPAAPRRTFIMEPAVPSSGSMTQIETPMSMPMKMYAPSAPAPSTIMPPQLTPAPMSATDMMPAPMPSPSPSV